MVEPDPAVCAVPVRSSSDSPSNLSTAGAGVLTAESRPATPRGPAGTVEAALEAPPCALALEIGGAGSIEQQGFHGFPPGIVDRPDGIECGHPQ